MSCGECRPHTAAPQDGLRSTRTPQQPPTDLEEEETSRTLPSKLAFSFVFKDSTKKKISFLSTNPTSIVRRDTCGNYRALSWPPLSSATDDRRGVTASLLADDRLARCGRAGLRLDVRRFPLLRVVGPGGWGRDEGFTQPHGRCSISALVRPVAACS